MGTYDFYQEKGDGLRPSVVQYLFATGNEDIRKAFEVAAGVTFEAAGITGTAMCVNGASKDHVNRAMRMIDELADSLIVTVPDQKLETILKKAAF